MKYSDWENIMNIVIKKKKKNISGTEKKDRRWGGWNPLTSDPESNAITTRPHLQWILGFRINHKYKDELSKEPNGVQCEFC